MPHRLLRRRQRFLSTPDLIEGNTKQASISSSKLFRRGPAPQLLVGPDLDLTECNRLVWKQVLRFPVLRQRSVVVPFQRSCEFLA